MSFNSIMSFSLIMSLILDINSSLNIILISSSEVLYCRPKIKRPESPLSNDIGYVLYSALGSFYIPSCIMVFVYIRIYYAAKARARRGIRKPPPRPKATEKDTSPVDKNSNSPVAVTVEKPAIPVVTCDFASDISTSDNVDMPETGKETLQVSVLKLPQQSSLTPNVTFKGSTLSVNGDLAAAMSRNRAPSVGIDPDMVSEFDPSSSDSGVVSRCAVVKPLKLRLCKPIFGRKSSKAKREVIDIGRITGSSQEIASAGAPDVPKVVKPRDPEREKRRIARKKEKRATLILGLIMGSFIACWLPFFFLYILTPMCSICDIPDFAFAVAFWLGYMNSALNPVIYTIFNKDFRRAFRRILFK
ncbi:unnamed protein product [Nesidiocoris tenuis]|uniref:G-protein coupled receptors family 1 profile domain-containing protein n=1 Tax=Nesidiocoris tenuis TaxID=355587 RepID=A0A6H5HQ62_9HEMI|nr:unnamed protein product [Nesidiocoris tenuis]